MLNRHLRDNAAYQIGVHHDKGARRTMEDAYSFVVDFAGVRGQGYFAVFDGHAGKYAAEWCGGHFHEVSQPFTPLRGPERTTLRALLCHQWLPIVMDMHCSCQLWLSHAYTLLS